MYRTATRTIVTLAASALALAVGAPGASAANHGWNQVVPKGGQNTDDHALVRDAAGTLHLAFLTRQSTSVVELGYATLPAGGVRWQPGQRIVTSWVSLTDPDLEVVDGTLHAFWSGQSSTDVADPGSSGRAWYATLGADGTWSPTAAPMTESQSAYASSQVSSAVGSDGRPWISWSGTSVLATHQGLDQLGPEQNLSTACCEYASNLARDSVSGAMYLVYSALAPGRNGYFARQVDPALGPEIALPDRTEGDDTMSRDHRLAAASRTTGGVYTAYCETSPSCTSIRVAGTDGSSLVRSVRGMEANPEKVWTAAAPQGRMWLAWATNDERMFVTRSNRALTAWGPVRELRLPDEAEQTWYVFGDGARGPLDAFVTLTGEGDVISGWHQRVMPSLVATAAPASVTAGAARTVRIRVTDAGDPAAASVTLLGTTRTAVRGVATFTIPATVRPGRFTARATTAGYVPASTVVRVVPAR